MKNIIKSFIAGFMSTLVFHQGVFGLLYLAKIIPIAPYNMAPVAPLGVPSVISLAFFGGLWGILIWRAIKDDKGMKFWLKSIVLGSLGPTAVAFLVVFPIKEISYTPIMIVFGLILNAFWGLGNSIFMRIKV